MSDKMLNAQCRDILKNYEGAIDYLIAEIETELDKTRVEGNNAFEYAKATIRRQSMKEALTLFKQRMSRYAAKQ